MGGRTNALVELADAVSHRPPPRELDALLSTGESVSTALLAMALQKHGVDAVSLRAWEVGIETEGPHGHARIRRVQTERLASEIAAGRTPVVAGFQGISGDGALTTLGRGGSDTTAVAIAAALDATCELCSDVDGVLTADPRDVPDALLLDELHHDEMLAYSRQGAGVLNEDAIALARATHVSVRARSTFNDGRGTLVTPTTHRGLVGIASRREVFRISGDADTITELSRAHHLVTRRSDHDALIVLHEAAQSSDLPIDVQGPFTTVALVGQRAWREVARARNALRLAGIATLDRYASPFALTFLINDADRADAVRALHQLFFVEKVTHASA